MSSQNISPRRLKLLVGLLIVTVVTSLGWYYQASFENYADTESTTQTQSLSKVIQDLNSQMISLKPNKATVSTTAVTTETTSQILTEIAEKRKTEMLKLLKSNPKDFILSSMPENLRQEYPGAVQEQIEKQTTMDGTVRLMFTDNFTENKGETTYWLEADNNIKYQLYFTEDQTESLSGARVSLSGVILDNNLAVSGISRLNNDVLAATTSTLASSTPKVNKTAVILIKFQNDSSELFSKSAAKSVVYTTARNYFKEVSYGKIDIQGKIDPNGDMFGWYTVPYNSSECSPTNWENYAKAAAINDGLDLYGYDTIIYLTGADVNCTCGGTVGEGTPNTVIIYGGAMNSHVVIHELGHLFKAFHASTYICTKNGSPVPISDNCVDSQYGDPFDVMAGMPSDSYGVRNTNHINSYFKEMAGWLQPTNSTIVTASGTYTIAPLEKSSATYQMLKIPRRVMSIESSFNIQQYYTIEFRQPYGFDNYNANDPVSKGVLIRLAPATAKSILTSYFNSALIDTVASTSTFKDAPLTVGNTFTDPDYNISIKLNSISASGAVVQVTMNPPGSTCFHERPSVEVTPQYSQAVTPGTPVTYQVKITNNDTTACSASEFTFERISMDNWTYEYSPNPITIAPRASGIVNFTVTSSKTALNGNYSTPVVVYNKANTIYNVRESAAYWIVGGSDLELFKFTSYRRVKQGDIIKYYLFVTNASTKTLNNVVITDPIPAGTHYVDGSADNGGSYNSSTNSVNWNLTLFPSEQRIISFTIRTD